MDDIKLWRDSNRKATSESERTKQQPGELGDISRKENVVVLAATNTPWMVDKAFLRPGRFDRLVHVGLPSREDRGSILKVHASKMKMKDEQNVAGLCERIAEKTKGFSGADLSALCRAAAVRCLIEGSDSIEERHFFLELTESFTASSNLDLVERNMDWRP
jgi:SpoVK/Ycf46/Vps4 family AAA+-type ATPase